MTIDRYRLEVATMEYWMRNVPCQYACPVRTDAARYVQACATGDYEFGYFLARSPNAQASVCGRVCGCPCEIDCRRGMIDEPITIRALKGFLTSRCGVEASQPSASCNSFNPRVKRHNTGPRVAIIGAGPGGLEAAHDLAKWGYQVTIFERHSEPGGLLVLGIPRYRLDRELVKMEIEAICNGGVEIRTDTPIGPDFPISRLEAEGFEAIIIDIGMMDGRLLPLEGVELEGVYKGIDFVRDVILGKKVKVGERVIVIGGGNVAFDACRSAMRVGPKEVTVICLENVEEMLADDFEIEEGVREGVKIINRKGPKRVIGENGKVVGLETIDASRVFDEQGRFSPQYIEGTEKVYPADTVIFTIGQKADFSFLTGEQGIETTKNGLIACDPQTLTTSRPGVFAVGDIATGPKLIITAQRSGQMAAIAVDTYLAKKRRAPKLVEVHRDLPYFRLNTGRIEMPIDYTRQPRRNPSSIPHWKAAESFDLVEIGFDEEQARQQGERCLKCNINTIFNGPRCIMCNGCVDVCPEKCLMMVDITEIYGADPDSDKVIEAWCDRYLGGQPQEPGVVSVMLKDETACIRCALCAARCPTETITMEEFMVEEIDDQGESLGIYARHPEDGRKAG